MSGDDRDRLRAYVRGELDEAAASNVEAEAASDPSVSDALRRLAREEIETLLDRPVGDPTESIRTTMGIGSRGEAPSVKSLADNRLELGEILGQGGMGVVHLGHQPHLGRTVAVKSANEAGEGGRVQALLSEAFITGQLEHPNIVPIHDIVLDEHGTPQVVLKRVEGSSWKELMADPEQVKLRFDVTDVLAWHLRVLLSVCQALRFAHSRGIVHRDVKPANVMLGRFGEIYLLDWGLAWRVPSENDAAGRRAEHAIGFGGSPAYMAPEQFAPDLSGIGAHTDVYLVGATLFEVLMGRPPRRGKELAQHLADSLERAPDLDPTTPPELAAIVQKAMAPEPKDRFATIQELRLAIQSFLEHRASRRLADKATASVAAMDRALAAKDDASAERAFVEATFGYRAALDAWSDNVEAKRALGALIERRVEDALASGAIDTAARLLAVAPDIAAPLAARVREAVAEHARREEELARLAADQDRTAGVAVRRLLTLLIFGSWVGYFTYVGIRYPMPASEMVVGPAVIATFGIALILVARRQLKSKSNQNLIWVTLSMMVATVSWLVAAAQLDLDPRLVPLPLPLIWAFGTVAGAVTIDRRALPAGFVYALGFYIAVADLSQIRWVLGATSLFWLLNALVVNVLITRALKRESR